ncbi:tetratricopeptide repeat protein [Dactylosporangium sp. CA-233914]|uniref:tetratricopeptide repeat protein n=1 Tax=Dactylosporangium sp. CA-233914 TaxID=3239934 RepID=UPI003D8FF9F2
MTAASVLPAADEALAQRLLPIVMADPGKAKNLAESALRDARRDGDPGREAVALRALGLVARARHDAAAAAEHLRASMTVARRHGLKVHEAEARMSHALILDDLGRPSAALKEIDRAVAELHGHRRARATMQRALILRRLGFDHQAMELYRGALRSFRSSGDQVWEARTLTNRGVLHGYRGNLKQAENDLRAAQALYNRLGMSTAAAQVEHNLGFVAAQAGDVPTALARYDRAHDRLWSTGVDAVSLLDRADLLLSVRLLPEAESAIRAAIDACTDGHLDSVLGQAHLMLARHGLAAGTPNESRDAAAAARRVFHRQGRSVWSARARVAEIAAVVALGRANRGTLRELRSVAAHLLEAGWLQPGWDALLDAAQLAVDLGELYTARELLTEAGGAAKLGPAPLRVRWWHIRARVELASGAVAESVRAATAGCARPTRIAPALAPPSCAFAAARRPRPWPGCACGWPCSTAARPPHSRGPSGAVPRRCRCRRRTRRPTRSWPGTSPSCDGSTGSWPRRPPVLSAPAGCCAGSACWRPRFAAGRGGRLAPHPTLWSCPSPRSPPR